MLLVSDIMQADVRTIAADAPVADAIMALADSHISGLPVLDRTGQLVGVVSSTDILAAEAESVEGGGLNQVATHTRVSEIMSRQPKTVDPTTPVKVAAQEMLYLDVHRLLVVKDGKLMGVISQSDIVRAVASGRL
ncbi:MAG TPA: CBS domain-containing protein [Gemmatimonadales bacterium]